MKRALFSLVALCLTLCPLPAAFAQVAAVPTSINFQGRLTKPDGTPVTDVRVNLLLSLFNAPSGGTLLWQRSLLNVLVRNGTFAIRLDFSGGYQNGATQATLFGAPAVFLEISINGAAPLTPRQPFQSVAYAMKANAVMDGAITANSLADNAVTGAKIADGTITGADLAAATITTDKFASGIFNPVAWLLHGNSGVTSGFLGTTDTNPLELRVNNLKGLRIEYVALPSGNSTQSSHNIIGGYWGNFVPSGVIGATIWGGSEHSAIGPLSNRVYDHFGTVSGGSNNQAGSDDGILTNADHAVVAGGLFNRATGSLSFIGSGNNNVASGTYAVIGGGQSIRASGAFSTAGGGTNNRATGEAATVPGGKFNTAAGLNSFAAGQQAVANHSGTFVWNDSADTTSGNTFTSTAANQFLIQASGGVGIGTNAPVERLHVAGDVRIVSESDAGTTIGSGALHILNTAGTIGLHLDQNEVQSLGSNLLINGNNTADTVINNFVTIDTSQRVGIGDSTPDATLDVVGNIICTTLTQTSDAHYKENIVTFPDALDAILNLRGVTFDWKHNDFPDMNLSAGRQIGFIAQEVEKVLPGLVTTDQNGYKSVAYSNVVPILVEAIKQQQKQIESRDDRLNAQQQEIDVLKAQLAKLMAAVRELQKNR